MTKRLIVLLLIFAVSVSILTACNSNSESNPSRYSDDRVVTVYDEGAPTRYNFASSYDAYTKFIPSRDIIWRAYTMRLQVERSILTSWENHSFRGIGTLTPKNFIRDTKR